MPPRKKPTAPGARPPRSGVQKQEVRAPVTKLTDTFTTISGQTMTRRQLSNLVSRANYRAQQSIKYLTPGEYQNVKENFERGIASTGLYPAGQGRYTLAGITDPKELRKIEAAARKALESRYLTPARYKQIEDRRAAALAEKGIEGKDYQLLKKIFKSQEWHRLQKSGYSDSDQIIQMLKDELLSTNKLNNQNFGMFKKILGEYGRQLEGAAPKPIQLPSGKTAKRQSFTPIYKGSEAEGKGSRKRPKSRKYTLDNPDDVIDAFLDVIRG